MRGALPLPVPEETQRERRQQAGAHRGTALCRWEGTAVLQADGTAHTCMLDAGLRAGNMVRRDL
jgi:hypothetical protein